MKCLNVLDFNVIFGKTNFGRGQTFIMYMFDVQVASAIMKANLDLCDVETLLGSIC